ncbi:MAG: hypothetical protein ACYC8T_29885 [Myxococcaceae bacterium]
MIHDSVVADTVPSGEVSGVCPACRQEVKLLYHLLRSELLGSSQVRGRLYNCTKCSAWLLGSSGARE